MGWNHQLVFIIPKTTLPKFNNKSSEQLPKPSRKVVFQPSFSGAMLNFGWIAAGTGWHVKKTPQRKRRTISYCLLIWYSMIDKHTFLCKIMLLYKHLTFMTYMRTSSSGGCQFVVLKGGMSAIVLCLTHNWRNRISCLLFGSCIPPKIRSIKNGTLQTDPGTQEVAIELLDTQGFFGVRTSVGPTVGDFLESWKPCWSQQSFGVFQPTQSFSPFFRSKNVRCFSVRLGGQRVIQLDLLDLVRQRFLCF